MPNTIIHQNRAVRALPAQGPSGGPPVTKTERAYGVPATVISTTLIIKIVMCIWPSSNKIYRPPKKLVFYMLI